MSQIGEVDGVLLVLFFVIACPTLETNGRTPSSHWLCFIILRYVTQMNGFELFPTCSDGCQFLGRISEV